MNTLLVRYGVMAEVGRFGAAQLLPVGESVVVQTARGLELGTVVSPAAPRSPAPDTSAENADIGDRPTVLRNATADDHATAAENATACAAEFAAWQERIVQWNVDVELIDIERTLDAAKLVLYVLNDRGPETTKLAIRAAAAGFGVIEVQPIGPEGLVYATGGGCGSGGCRK